LDENNTASDESDAVELAKAYIAEGLSTKDAAKRASEETGAARNELYKRLIAR
jgi:16S rRNA C1402 (ribose-2'-O) methylase RsmI